MNRAITRTAAVAALLLTVLCSVPSLAAQQGNQSSQNSTGGSNNTAVLGLPESAGPVEVRAAFQLLNISAIHDESETVEFSGVLALTWTDKRQAFDPAAEGVSEKVYQGAFQFNEISPAWYPQVTLVNGSGAYESRAVLLRVWPDGTSTLTESIDATAKVSLNLRRYPFDRQQLELVFQVFGFDTGQVVLNTDAKSASADGTMIRLSQWDLGGVRATTRTLGTPYVGAEGRSSACVVTMDVKRRPLFTLRLVVVPLILIVMLSWVVFWMHRSSLGDRMSVSFVGILTAVAYQNLVGSALPQIAYVTLMNGFLNISLFMMCVTAVINLVVAGVDENGNLKRGDEIDRRCRWIFPSVYGGLLVIIVAVSFLYF